MNYGPIIFLGLFFTMATSWFGMVFVPQTQIGRQQPVAIEATGQIYPAMPPGAAHQGAEIYRANGCYYCHSQQVRQTGYTFNVRLVDAGTNTVKLAAALTKLGVKGSIPKTPSIILSDVSFEQAEQAVQRLANTNINAKAERVIIPLGADIRRGWGARQSVAADYLYDAPAMIGQQRIGPDLTNVGQRSPSEALLMLHLYNPNITVDHSTMPPYPYLFELQKIGSQPSPDALKLTGPHAPKAGYEVVPRLKARQLVAYLQSLKVETPLFEAPMTTKPAPAATNAVASATNAAPAGATNSISPAK